MDTNMDGPGGSVMRRLEEGRLLPWRYVRHTTWTKLANKLDLISPVSSNDWRGLAEILGFSTEDILVLETSKDRNTLALFTNYLPKKNSSVNSVAKALKQMNRDDALQILLDAVPDIEDRFDLELQKPGMEAVEGEDTCFTNVAQGGCRCLSSPSSLSCNNQHGGGSCSPCQARHHPHPHPPLPCSLGSGSCCCPHVANSHQGHCHSPPVPYSPYAPHPQRAHMPSFDFNIRPETGYKDGHRPALLQHSQSQPHPHHHPPTSHRQYSDLHAAYRMPDSMAVNHDVDSHHPHQHHHRDLHSYAAHNHSMELDEGGMGGGRREEPVAMHAAIARGQGLVSGMSLPMEVMTDAGDDNTPSTSLEELSSSDSSSRLQPLNFGRQVSEECNSKQPYSNTSTSPKGSHMYGKGSDNVAAWAADTRRATGSGNNYKENHSSLKQLETLSQLPPCYKPDQKYTTMVAEQKVEEADSPQRNRQIKRERGDSSRSCQFSSAESSRSGASSSSSGKSRTPVGAETFPMRVKPQTGGATVEQVRSRQPGILTKTTSVPIDMKMEEFKKAFRHIKVFVTYASDSKQQVLSLCHCLDRNGFTCCVDVAARHDNPDQLQAARDWCYRKFKETDFVLVCLSPAYMKEIERGPDRDRPPRSSSRSSKGWLQAGYIYQLMEEEFQATGRCSRFVPLYMEGGGACDIGPAWLTNHLSYHWPRQYKDLLWMLTKPEERLKHKSRSSPQKGQGHRGMGVKVNGVHQGHLVSSPLH